MISFENDYNKGAHPYILKRLLETNDEALSGYGFDKYTLSAKEKIKKECGKSDAEVYFISGGTQTNSLVISSFLDSYEGVISAQTGHIATHEAGAIEATGHKVITLPGHDGKLCADDVRDYLNTFFSDANHDHAVFPGMVYISFPTEYGTLYSKKELTELSAVCREYDIPLYLDGARLGYGLASDECDLTMHDIAELCDVFYIGGTKVGALCGEALVISGKPRPSHFMTRIKRHGALLAKGRVCGVQFDALFTDGLYYEISKNAIESAKRLKKIFADKGYPLFCDSPTNQQFVILENERMKALSDKVVFSFWESYGENHSVVRFATSWATTDWELSELEKLL